MPSHNSREFIKGTVRNAKRERWCFTPYELKNPHHCKSKDTFVAEVGAQVGVIVRRNGKVTNYWEDGTSGVTRDVAASAEMEEELRKPVYWGNNLPQNDEDEYASDWRTVLVMPDGRFLKFAPDEPVAESSSLALSLLDANNARAAADYIKRIAKLPTGYQDLIDMGLEARNYHDFFEFLLRGFYVQGMDRPGGVSLTIRDHRMPGDVMLTMYHTAWGDLEIRAWPLGAYYGKWEIMKPPIAAWKKTLVFNLPDDVRRLPTLTEWINNWHALGQLIRARLKNDAGGST